MLLLAGPSLRGQDSEEIITDRPDQTESASTIAPGFVQIETGAAFISDDEDGLETETFEFPSTLLRIGLVDRVELRIAWDGLQRFEGSQDGVDFKDTGSGDTALGIKIGLTDNPAKGLETALLIEGRLPTGDEAFTSDRPDPSLRYIIAHELSESIGIGYNVGVVWETEGGAQGTETLASAFYTVATGFGLTNRLGTFVELFGAVGLDTGAQDTHAFDGGFTYLVTHNVQLDIAGGFGLNSAAEDWFVGIGVSARIPR